MIRAVAVLALALAATSSQPPPPAPRKPAQENQNQAAPEKSKAETDQQSASPPPAGVKRPRPVVALRNLEQRGTSKKDKPPVERWPKINAILVTVFTGVLAVLAAFQWFAMKKQSEAMTQQLAEIKSGGADTHDLAVAAKGAAAASEQQSRWAEISTTAMQQQVSALLHQAEAMTVQASAAIKSAEAALDSAKMAKLLERPWITASIVARDPLTFFRGSGVSFSFWLVLENLGRSVATDISYVIDFFPVGFVYAHEVVHERQRSISAKLARTSGPGFSLFPGEVGRIHTVHSVEPEAVEECTTHHTGEHFVILCVAGEIRYGFTTSDSQHTTKFAYYVGQHESDTWRTVIHIDKTLPQDEIVFLKEHRASFAD